jgi:hypothetical protein
MHFSISTQNRSEIPFLVLTNWYIITPFLAYAAVLKARTITVLIAELIANSY